MQLWNVKIRDASNEVIEQFQCHSFEVVPIDNSRPLKFSGMITRLHGRERFISFTAPAGQNVTIDAAME